MTMRALAKVQLDTAVQLDRYDIAASTLIPNQDWHYEAEFTAGRIADIHMYRRTRHPESGEVTWVWYGAIPSSRVKGYQWVEADIPTNVLIPKKANAESEAEAAVGHQAGAPSASVAALQRR